MLPKSVLHGRPRPAWPLIRFVLPVLPFRIFWWLRFPSMALSFAMLLVNMVWAFCPWELAPAAVVGCTLVRLTCPTLIRCVPYGREFCASGFLLMHYLSSP